MNNNNQILIILIILILLLNCSNNEMDDIKEILNNNTVRIEFKSFDHPKINVEINNKEEIKNIIKDIKYRKPEHVYSPFLGNIIFYDINNEIIAEIDINYFNEKIVIRYIKSNIVCRFKKKRYLKFKNIWAEEYIKTLTPEQKKKMLESFK